MTRRVLIGLFAGAALLTPPRLAAQGLFESDQILQVRLSTDFKALMDDRDSLKSVDHPGMLSYVDANGQPVSITVALKTRGHWRRQKKNCDFAPLKVDFPKSKEQPSGSIFAGQGNLKLITHCRSKDATFEQYVLREFMVYRLYNLLSPVSFRARLVRATYVDAVGKQDSITRYGFFLEDDKRMAERANSMLMETKGAHFEDLEPTATATMSAFQYLIGNTDWSLVGLHNIVLTQNKETGAVVPVPYDFDWTGIVNTKYSFPDYRLPIKSVRERIYRGVCRKPEEWEPVLQAFREKKVSLYSVYDGFPAVDAKYVKDTKDYLEGFYQVIDKPSQMKIEMINACKQA
jgi:hypothetical protein